MAQWIGQLSGNPDERRVKEAESDLRNLLSAHQSDGDTEDHLFTLRNSADRIRTARLKCLRAKLGAVTAACTAAERTKLQRQRTNAERRIQILEQSNADTILAEFGYRSA